MAEFCKDCFKKYLLSSEDRERIKDENIIMFPTKDLCEGCGEIKSVVDYVIWEEDQCCFIPIQTMVSWVSNDLMEKF